MSGSLEVFGEEKKPKSKRLVTRSSGGVGFFHVKGWAPNNSACRGKPNFFCNLWALRVPVLDDSCPPLLRSPRVCSTWQQAMAKFAPHMGFPHGDPHADPHVFLAWLVVFQSTKSMWFGLLWAGGKFRHGLLEKSLILIQ